MFGGVLRGCERGIKIFFDRNKDIYTETAETIENDMYVDDLLTRGVTFCTIGHVKETF